VIHSTNILQMIKSSFLHWEVHDVPTNPSIFCDAAALKDLDYYLFSLL